MRIRILSLLFVAVAATAQVTFPSLNSSPWLGQELLTRIESTSVTVNVATDKDMQVYFEYGTSPGVYPSSTKPQTAAANTPLSAVLDNLKPNTRYYYRMQYAATSAGPFTARPEHNFTTQRPRGASFSFAVQADPHLDNNSSSDSYKLSMANMLVDQPDFFIDLGDNILTDKLNASGVPVNGGSSPNQAGILTRAQLHRSFYDLVGHSVPLFQVLGNHEAEWGNNLNGTPNNMAIWNTQIRNTYFPTPAPDAFFSGDTQSYDLNGKLCIPGPSLTCGLGQRKSYYAWEWGDALFVVLDPFWSQTPDVTPAEVGNGKACCQKNAGYWSLTLGAAQYSWLKQTLESSTSKYKFVFSHNLVGGTENTVNGVAQGPMRGGVESAKYLEWGGYNLDGTWGFGTYRPDMPAPIHQLLVANKVSAFFHGHDHLYAHQELDGIMYQEVPQPSASNGNLSTRASDYGYYEGTLVGGRGYLRVDVSPDDVKVNYVEAWLPNEIKGTIKNAMLGDSYSMITKSLQPVITRVANAGDQSTQIAPNTWVEIDGKGLAPAGTGRSWRTADFAGGKLPTSLDGISVTVNGKAAYVSYISPTQINILTPTDALNGPVNIQVSIANTYSAFYSAPSKPASPSFFTFPGGEYIAATHANGTLLGPTTLYPGASTPAKPGEIVVLYGNGFGDTTPAVTPGNANPSGTLSPLPVIQIGGVQAAVQFGGIVSPGLYQFNVVVPAVGDGDQPITATRNGTTTQSGLNITIKN